MNAFFYRHNVTHPLDTFRFACKLQPQDAICALRERNHSQSIIRAENHAESSKASIEEKSIIPLVCLQASDPLSQVLDGGKGGLQIPSR